MRGEREDSRHEENDVPPFWRHEESHDKRKREKEDDGEEFTQRGKKMRGDGEESDDEENFEEGWHEERHDKRKREEEEEKEFTPRGKK